MAGGRSSEQSGEMEAQSVVARNGGYRGWRHEGAVTMPTKRRRGARRWWQAVAATADGCMRGAAHRPHSSSPHAYYSFGE